MEEKLRNLSQNIANNTGDEHKPKKHNPEEEHREEHHEEKHHDEESREEHNEPREKHEDATPWEEEVAEEEVSDYTPEPENQPEEEHHEELKEEPEDKEPHHEEETREQSAEENSDTDREATSIEITEIKEPDEEPKEEEEKEEKKPEEKAKILTMETEDEEPKESPTRTKKYSPEVEAALSRLNSEEVAVDLNSEPLSTEPKKKHHGGRIFLFILFVIAIAAVALCVLVEQGIIDNPLNMFNKKSEPTAVKPVEPEPEPEKDLTDEKLIAEIDALFTEVHKDSSLYYIFKKSYQKTSDNEFVYYYVAEPSETTEKLSTENLVSEPVTDCIDSSQITEEGAVTDCATPAEPITAENYKNYPSFRYIFQKTEFGLYEFLERAPIVNEEALTNTEK